MKCCGIRKRKKQRAIAPKDAETEEAYCFLTVRLNLREPITKKASGGYEYLADTTVNSLLAFSKNFSYKNLTRTYPMSDVDFFSILL